MHRISTLLLIQDHTTDGSKGYPTLQNPEAESQNLTKWLRMAGVSVFFWPNPCPRRDIQSGVLRPMSRLLLKFSEEEILQPLGSLCQGIVNHTA